MKEKERMLRVSEDGQRRREGYVESYRQLGRSLLDLQHAADRIFDAISERTAKEREKLTEISRRIQTAKARIDAISRSEQALIIKSPSRYPSSCITEEDFNPLFQYKDEQTDDGFLTKLLVNGGLNREFGKDGTLELFHFFSEENTECILTEAQPKVRVKPIDSNQSTFLEDLLETPQFTSSSFLAVKSNASDITLDPKKQGLPPLPPSLLLHNIPPLRKSEDFKSTANVKPVHDIKLPDTLSDLTHERKDAHSDPMVSDLAVSDE